MKNIKPLTFKDFQSLEATNSDLANLQTNNDHSF